MKKDSILVRVIAVLLSINVCFGLVWIAIFGAIKPLTISFTKNVVADEMVDELSKKLGENNIENSDNKVIIDKVMENVDQIEDLIEIYIDGLSDASAGNKDVKFKDTSAIYDKLNNEIIDIAQMQEGVKFNQNQRDMIEKQLQEEESRIEKELSNMVNNANTNINPQITLAIQVYDNFASGRYLINMSIVLLVVVAIIIAIRWKSKGWLINLGVAGLFSSVFIVIIPSLISLFVEYVMEKKYVIAGDSYFYVFAGITFCVSIAMIIVKNTVFKFKNDIAEEKVMENM